MVASRLAILALASALTSCGAPVQLKPPSAAELEAPVAATPAAPSVESVATPHLEQRVTILAVADLSHSVAFYHEIFAWPVKTRTPDFVAFDLGDGSSLGLHDRDGFTASAGKAPEALPYGSLGGAALYLLYDDPTALLKRLQERGARVLSPFAARAWGDEAAYFADPDGHVLAVARRAR